MPGFDQDFSQFEPVEPQQVVAEWVERTLERPYVTQEGDFLSPESAGLAIWRGGRMVEFIRYKEHA